MIQRSEGNRGIIREAEENLPTVIKRRRGAVSVPGFELDSGLHKVAGEGQDSDQDGS